MKQINNFQEFKTVVINGKEFKCAVRFPECVPTLVVDVLKEYTLELMKRRIKHCFANLCECHVLEESILFHEIIYFKEGHFSIPLYNALKGYVAGKYVFDDLIATQCLRELWERGPIEGINVSAFDMVRFLTDEILKTRKLFDIE